LLWFDKKSLSGQYRVLITEGNESEQRLWREYLADLECEIQFVADGKHVLEHAQRFQPGVLVMNVTFPMLDLDGVCRKLKEGADTQGIMVLAVVSGPEHVSMAQQAISAGIDDLVSKPIDKPELQKRVRILLQLKEVAADVLSLKRRIDDQQEPDY
jgi:two-component system cell cycle response regulator